MTEEVWTNKKVDKFVVVNDPLGQGQFGKVYRGFFANDEKRYVACKVIKIATISNSDKYLDLIKKEIQVLQKLSNNPFIVKLFDVARTSNNLYLFLEFCQDGDLKEYLKSKSHLSEDESVLFFKHICEGFKDLDRQNIIHRDIKPANLLLHEGSIKMSDFGFARTVESTSKTAYFTRLGSPLYMAPQILEGTPFNAKCDVWSTGIVFYEMLYGTTPWTGTDQFNLLKNIQKKPLLFPQKPARSDMVKDLIKGMLKINQDERFSWQQVFDHPLLQEPKIDPALEQSQKIEKEDLELIQQNFKYVEPNRVAGILNNNVPKVGEQQQQQNQQTPSQLIFDQSEKKSLVPNKDIDENDNSKIVQFKNEKEVRKSMQKMTKFFLFERNVAFFMKNAMKIIFSYFWSKKIDISFTLYYKVIFCLCKCQTIFLLKVCNSINEEKSSLFTDYAHWQKYQKTAEYKQTRDQLQKDKDHSIKFYNDLMNRTQQALNKEISKDPNQKAPLEAFMVNLNQNFVMEKPFVEAYKSSMSEIIKTLSDVVRNNKDIPKEILVLLRYLIVSQNPYKEFDSGDVDFNSFYEEVENMAEEKLKEEIFSKLQ